MTKVFALRPREDWICDRFVDEWDSMSHQATMNPNESDVIWLLSDWCWRRVPRRILERKRVITSVHHIVPTKFDAAAQADFAERDEITTVYHVPCEATREQIKDLTQKPIHVIPFWVNDRLWPSGAWWKQSLQQRATLRASLGIPADSYVVGSFQRDTEGSDLVSPKLEKGPDLLCDALEVLAKKEPNLLVVLGGWRRQYVMGRLLAAGIPYRTFELPPSSVIKDLYCTLDMYIVAARYEGGPQAIVECAVMGVPIVSTPVGLAQSILHPQSVGFDVTKLRPDTTHARDMVEPLLLPHGMEPFYALFDSVMR